MMEMQSPVQVRPRPEFPPETFFSQKKRTPFRPPRPPRAPAKSCPPVSRIFWETKKHPATPQVVSFKSQVDHDTLHSPHYKAESPKSYLDQCFEMRAKLGEGSFGEVFQVCSRDDGKMYAIKKSHQPFRGALDRKRKLAEVEKHERLAHHPNCVQFHKAWEERQKLYIQTELCLMSLAEHAELHGKVPEQRIWCMLIDLVKGLKHLHDNQLCHLDIKPANIFLGRDEFTCKIGDFGLCSNVDQGFSEEMEGDAKYLAPELMKHQFGKPADIFSLGISLLELACGVELPSGGEGWHLLRSGRMPPDLTKDLSSELVSILARMMHPDPQLRPTVDDILSAPCVTLAGYRHSCYKASYWLLSSCKHMLGRLLAVVMFLFTIFPAKRASDIADSWTPEGVPVNVHDDSFSDDEVLHGSMNVSHLSDHNTSWIKNSPVRYPNNVYAGPPIPIDFSDSSFDEGSPEKASRGRSPLAVKSSRTVNGIANHQRKKLLQAFEDQS